MVAATYWNLLSSLLRVDSTSGRERDAALMLHDFLQQRFAYDILELQEIAPERYNLLLIKGEPCVTLSSHIDTVPGLLPVVEKEEAIFGRGACDAKGQIVTQLYALEQAIAHGLQDYACFFVVGEEVDSVGAIAAAKDSRLRSRYLVNGEPTENRFVKRTRGILEFGLTASGTTKHTSQPPLDSAVHKLIGDLGRVLEAADEQCSINIGRITGGIASNVSADYARADFSARFETSVREVAAKIADCVRESTLEITSAPIEPFELFVPAEYRATAPSVLFSTDAAHYADNFEHIMLFGPGWIGHAHGEFEHLQKHEMATAAEMLLHILLRF